MANSLFTGVSGLIAHQRMLDVVGDNLANMNTTGFKSSRVHFADMFYSTLIRPASSPVDDNLGGVNPAQVGSGVKLAQIAPEFKQGILQQTGATFDFAMEGEGFFVAHNGQRNVYTRAGAFSLDESGYLVDPATGFRVQRFGTVGEGGGEAIGFQTPGVSSIHIPMGTAIPGQATQTVDLTGNLDATASLPRAQVLTTQSEFTAGGAAADEMTLLNDLDSIVTPYDAGDVIELSGTDANGNPVSSTWAVDGTTTLGDLINAIQSDFPDTEVALDGAGNLVVTAVETGTSFLNISLQDAAANTGTLDFDSHALQTTTAGQEGGTFNTAIEVYDDRGAPHTVTLTFQRVNNNEWDMTAAIDPSQGTMLVDEVRRITFNENGSFQQVLGTGDGDSNLVFQFDGFTSPQTVELSFGSPNAFDGLTHLGASSTLAIQQDGFAPGNLVTVNVSSDGVLEGIASNGRRFPVAQLAIASFRNPGGLVGVGDNYFLESLNTGEVQIGTALSGGRGVVRGGQLESSNVEVALEFTRMIIAQRGFSANARTITVSDEMLRELTNIIR